MENAARPPSTPVCQVSEALNWRYAVKAFSDQEIPQDILDALIDALRLAPSFVGLQPYRVSVLQDTELRQRLIPHSFNQVKVATSSALFVVSVDTKITDKTVEDYVCELAAARGVEPSKMADLEAKAKAYVGTMTADVRVDWAKRQAYLAVGQLLTAAAILGVDACPMEGFSAADYDRILGLTERGQTTTLLIAAGYRAADDRFASLPKFRRSTGEFVLDHR
ncbi:NAD(P)H-dependent oxidoreductase [uncultured Tateyamaria sp.]|uniref:NAD(P)H-dependent oxidoreductase n=1 Tax=uncultured Tateyamaria sp. TaxID=455651 RepID=UPI002606589E|nr:NAD(P)H-dependent oxidoreductase [uncultured Tateyamaria sp.]